MATRHPLRVRSATVAIVDPALLPDDVVERLAIAEAIVVAEAHPGDATVLLGEDGGLVGLERPPGSPRPPLGLVGTAVAVRERARAMAQGALAGVIAAAPVAAVVASKGVAA